MSVAAWQCVRQRAFSVALSLLAAAPATATTFLSSRAADWPSRPVTIVVPNSPGGFTDIMARLLAHHLSQKFGQPFIIDNRAGGAGSIGATYVANARPDGQLFLLTSPSTILAVPLLQKVSYDPDSLIPVSIFGNLPFLLGIKAALPPKTLPEFVAYAKARPGKLNYASAGVGGISSLVSALFVKRAGIDVVHVPYKSAAPATAALAAGEVDMYFGGSPELMQHVSNERIRILATSGARRLANLPDTPAVNEFYLGVQLNTWEALMAPHGTPKAIVELMMQATIEAAKDPTIVERLTALGITPEGTTQAEFIEVIKKDRGLYAEAIKAAGDTGR
jgi:tripartite-type tricarboxylate transporter receptor subunit TctC